MIEKCAVMARCAQIAYMDGKEAKTEYRKLGYTSHRFIESDGAQVHIVSNKNEIVLCFRGTEPGEFSDIKADLNALPDRAQNGSGFVHNGFQEEVNKVWDQINIALSKMKLSDKKFYICGHSLGGAMATIATSRFGTKVDCLYTYGSPRTGTRKFVSRLVIYLISAMLTITTWSLVFLLLSWDIDTIRNRAISTTLEKSEK